MLLLRRSSSAILLSLLVGLVLSFTLLATGVAFAEEKGEDSSDAAREHIGCIGNAYVLPSTDNDYVWGGGMACTIEMLSIQLVHLLQRSDDGLSGWENDRHRINSCTTVNVCNFEENVADLESGYYRVVGSHAAIPYPWRDISTIYEFPVSIVLWVP